MKNNVRSNAPPDAGIRASLIHRGYRGTDLIFEHRYLFNPLEYLSLPVITRQHFYK